MYHREVKGRHESNFVEDSSHTATDVWAHLQINSRGLTSAHRMAIARKCHGKE